MSAALLFAGQQAEPLAFDADAREKWIAVYDQLSDGHPGMWGAATARAEAHTVRLALLYALLDCAPAIRVEHLDAALVHPHPGLSDLFNRNKKAREIDRALTALVEPGRLERGEQRNAAAGRPAAVWKPRVPVDAAA